MRAMTDGLSKTQSFVYPCTIHKAVRFSSLDATAMELNRLAHIRVFDDDFLMFKVGNSEEKMTCATKIF
jgi:hypothetical protein